MSIEYVCDDAARCIRLQVAAPLTGADLLSALERQLADGAWRYGSLVDARAVAHPPPALEAGRFASRLTDLVVSHGPRGPIIVVVSRSLQASAMVSILGDALSESIEVFWDVTDAQHWLTARMASREVPARDSRCSV